MIPQLHGFFRSSKFFQLVKEVWGFHFYFYLVSQLFMFRTSRNCSGNLAKHPLRLILSVSGTHIRHGRGYMTKFQTQLFYQLKAMFLFQHKYRSAQTPAGVSSIRHTRIQLESLRYITSKTHQTQKGKV